MKNILEAMMYMSLYLLALASLLNSLRILVSNDLIQAQKF